MRRHLDRVEIKVSDVGRVGCGVREGRGGWVSPEFVRRWRTPVTSSVVQRHLDRVEIKVRTEYNLWVSV